MFMPKQLLKDLKVAIDRLLEVYATALSPPSASLPSLLLNGVERAHASSSESNASSSAHDRHPSSDVSMDSPAANTEASASKRASVTLPLGPLMESPSSPSLKLSPSVQNIHDEIDFQNQTFQNSSMFSSRRNLSASSSAQDLQERSLGPHSSAFDFLDGGSGRSSIGRSHRSGGLSGGGGTTGRGPSHRTFGLGQVGLSSVGVFDGQDDISSADRSISR